VLYLVIVPAAIVAVIWALASLGGPQTRRRYRPGRPYDFVPVWYLANHRQEAGLERGIIASAERRPALPVGSGSAPDGSAPDGSARDEPATGVMQGTTGGASDRW
jgi:hypothetical protein